MTHALDTATTVSLTSVAVQGRRREQAKTGLGSTRWLRRGGCRLLETGARPPDSGLDQLASNKPRERIRINIIAHEQQDQTWREASCPATQATRSRRRVPYLGRLNGGADALDRPM